jgi:uncharacterized protein
MLIPASLTQALPDLARLEQHWQKLAFIACLCERHRGNFELYSEAMEREEATEYARLLNKVWEFIAGQLNSSKNLEKALLSLETFTPEPSEEDGYGVYPALDACLLLTSALQMTLDDGIDDTETAQLLSLSTISQFVIAMTGLIEEDLTADSSPLIADEITFQHEVIEQLQQAPAAATVTQLRRWLRSFEYTNLGIDTRGNV